MAPSDPYPMSEACSGGELVIVADEKHMIATTKGSANIPCRFCEKINYGKCDGIFTEGSKEVPAFICNQCITHSVIALAKEPARFFYPTVDRILQEVRFWLPLSQDKCSDASRILDELRAGFASLRALTEIAQSVRACKRRHRSELSETDGISGSHRTGRVVTSLTSRVLATEEFEARDRAMASAIAGFCSARVPRGGHGARVLA